MIDLPILTVTKDPDGTERYGIDWRLGPDGSAPYLDVGETITAAEWEADAGLEVVSGDINGSVTEVLVRGGTDGKDYDLRCRITTSASRITDRTMRVLVRNL